MLLRNKRLFMLIALAAVILTGLLGWFYLRDNPAALRFDGQRAYQLVETQLAFGPRTPGSPGHAALVDWLVTTLTESGWQARVQETTVQGRPVRNVVAQRGSGSRWIILGAHFDTREFADQDPDPAQHSQPVPGANDGASGVAVLLELARTLPADLDTEIWLAFFDAEDQGEIQGQNWIVGSEYFASQLNSRPDAVIIVDMIGDADLNIHPERNSDPALTEQIWEQAARLGYADQFPLDPKHRMIDDHIPFIRREIPAVDLIDFDYPYWHTLADTADKVSGDSLQAVGDTLWHWITDD